MRANNNVSRRVAQCTRTDMFKAAVEPPFFALAPIKALQPPIQGRPIADILAEAFRRDAAPARQRATVIPPAIVVKAVYMPVLIGRDRRDYRHLTEFMQYTRADTRGKHVTLRDHRTPEAPLVS